MDPNFYGLIVGINQYADPDLDPLFFAEKDANDIYGILTDSKIGMFPPANVDLLLGNNAGIENIQTALIQRVVHRGSADTVLVYFAGHAIALERQIYLVPADVSKTHIETNSLKYLSISLDSLRENVFRKCQARNIIFILDTCYSGSLLPKERGSSLKDLKSQILESFPETPPGDQHDHLRCILVSSEPSSPSVENEKLMNGLFTHRLLTGLRKGAVDSETGEVTIGSLFAHVTKPDPDGKQAGGGGQRSGGYIHGFGGVILVRHPLPGPDRAAITKFSISDISKLSLHPKFSSFTNPLDPYEETLDKLAAHLNDDSRAGDASEERAIHALQACTDAALALVLDRRKTEWDLTIKKQQEDLVVDEIITTVIPLLLAGIQAQDEIFSANRIGSYTQVAVGGRTIDAIAIPVAFNGSQKVVVLGFGEGTEKLPLYKSDLFAQIVSGIYYGLEQLENYYGPRKPVSYTSLLEAHLLDYLRRYNKYMPRTLYDKRIDLFNQRLGAMSVRFQPIIYLGMKEPFVCGFETLASDPDTNSTPHDLLRAAELWGTRFKVDLDSHFFETALALYKKRLTETRGYQRPNDILDLSINVYPETLLRTAYYEKVREMMAKKLVPTYRLYLEISEKSPNPEVIPNDGIATYGMTTFKDILKKYVRDFQIGFAIDDFGIGNSNVERLADLTPSYIKIDRKLTTHPTAYDAIKHTVDFIEEIVSGKHLSSSKIVLEGFDEEIVKKLSLGRLMELGIQFIQSYLIGMPTDKLARLDRDQTAYLLSLMNQR